VPKTTQERIELDKFYRESPLSPLSYTTRQSDGKYRSGGFEGFTNMKKSALRQVDYYKFHKRLHDYKQDYKRQQAEAADTIQRILPIFTKQEIIHMKHKKIDSVIRYNAATSPGSASDVMLKNMTDEKAKAMKRYYRQSNKALGNKVIDTDWFCKQVPSTI